MTAKRLGYLSAGLVLAASGIYLFVYLYRWEWNRAMIAGVILLIAEVALIGSFAMEKLTSIEERLRTLETDRNKTLDTIKETAPAPKSRFKWLTGDGDLNVFVPVLMGAGVLFAGIAWAVERFARLTARPALEQGLAMRLAPLALPDGSLTAPLVSRVPGRRVSYKMYRAPLMLALIATLFISIDTLGDLTQNRPDAPSVGGTGSIALEIHRNGFTRSPIEAARNLWAACSGTVSRAHSAKSFKALSGARVRIEIQPAPGPNAQRRLHGCFVDATLDNVQARLLNISITP